MKFFKVYDPLADNSKIGGQSYDRGLVDIRFIPSAGNQLDIELLTNDNIKDNYVMLAATNLSDTNKLVLTTYSVDVACEMIIHAWRNASAGLVDLCVFKIACNQDVQCYIREYVKSLYYVTGESK